jgi:splicing factor 3B subunit 3
VRADEAETDVKGLLVTAMQAAEAGTSVGPEFNEEVAAELERFGAPIGQPGQWASCLRIVDPTSLSTLHVMELDNNEAITSMALVQFMGAHDTSTLLAVGTAERMTYFPLDCTAGYIRIYRYCWRRGW